MLAKYFSIILNYVLSVFSINIFLMFISSCCVNEAYAFRANLMFLKDLNRDHLFSIKMFQLFVCN